MCGVESLLDALGEYGRVTETLYDTLNEVANAIAEDSGVRDFRVINMNIRSIKRNFDEFLVLMTALKVENIDCVVLTETWNINNIEYYAIEGYQQFYNQSTHNQNDGVIVYIKNKYFADFEIINLSETALLQVSVRAAFDMSVNIISVYRSPSSDPEMFIAEMDNYLRQHKRMNIDIIIGDMNFDILDLEREVNLTYSNMLASNGFLPYINTATRVTNFTESCLDHTFIATDMKIKIMIEKHNLLIKSGVVRTAITDHYTTFLHLKCNDDKQPVSEGPLRFREQRHTDLVRLDEILSGEDWDNVIRETNVQKIANNFFHTLRKHIKNCTNKIYFDDNRNKKKQWITYHLIECMKIRDILRLNG